MNTSAMMRLTLVTLLVGCLAGCHEPTRHTTHKPRHASPKSRKKAHLMKGSGVNILLKTMVWQDKAGKNHKLDLTTGNDEGGMPLPANMPLVGNCEFRLQVKDQERSYDVLFIPDRQHDAPVRGEIRTSMPSAYIHAGAVVVSGTLPLARSDWVHTSAQGSQWVVRVVAATEKSPGQHLVYSLQPKSATAPVDLAFPCPTESDPDDLRPMEYVVRGTEPSAEPAVRSFKPDDDDFIKYVYARAAEAGLKLKPIE